MLEDVIFGFVSTCKLKHMHLIFLQATKAQKHEFDVYKFKKHDVHFFQATEALTHEFQVL